MSVVRTWYIDSLGVRRDPRITRVRGQIYLDSSHIDDFPIHIRERAKKALETDERGA